MSSDDRERKRTGLAGQIEVEIIRDPQNSGSAHLYSSSASNPLRMLQELIEQMEELEQCSSDSMKDQLNSSQMQRQLVRFQRQHSALKRILDKAH
jgi:hypothetical protein